MDNIILKKVPFSKKDEELLRTRPCEKSRPILKKLKEWREESMNSEIIVC